jgi:hypothetical protein
MLVADYLHLLSDVDASANEASTNDASVVGASTIDSGEG